MKVQCKKCGSIYELDESFIGQKVECGCGEKWEVESPEKTKKCPMCGEEILEIAKKCRFCGEYLSEDNKPHRKNRFFYIFLGLFFGHLGAHNFYAEQYPAAIAKLVIGAFSLATALFSPEAWILPAFINVYFIVWDLCYDPNIPTGERKRILHLPPWIFSTIILIIFLITFFSFSILYFLLYEQKA